MRLRTLLLALCLLAFAFVASAQIAEPAPVEPAAVEIPPAYPVPDYVQTVLDIARAELGYEEQAGVTKYGTWAGNPKAQWCAEYLCWVIDQTDKQLGTSLLNTQFPLYSATNTGRDWYLAQGRYIARIGFVPDWGSQWYVGQSDTMERDSYIPQPGDWVFFSYGASGDTSHVAMVEKALRLPNNSVVIQVLEGNNPSAVARAQYALSDWRIQGYGTVRDLADIVLRMGAKGEKVRAIQATLAEVELLPADRVNGTYDQRTSDAVKVYQGMIGATATGIANQATQLSLQEYLLKWRAEHNGYFTVEEGL